MYNYNDYLEYIAKGLRFVRYELDIKFITNCILVVQEWSLLTEFEQIAGIPIYIANFDSSEEFILACNVKKSNELKQVSAFKEYLQLNSIGE